MSFHTIKVTGVPDKLLKLLDQRVQERQWLGRSEYIRDLIRRDVFGDPSLQPSENFEIKNESPAIDKEDVTSVPSKVYIELTCEGPSAAAQGVFVDGGLLVKKGSLSRALFVPSTSKGIVEQRKKLVEQGVLSLLEDGSQYCFTQNYLFTTPSMAASVVLARQANGWIEWKAGDRRALKKLIKGA